MFHSLFSAGNWVYQLPPALFDLSLTASIVILAVLLARLLLRRAPTCILTPSGPWWPSG